MDVFYSPSTATTIDVAVMRGGVLVAEISGEDLATLRRRYADAELGTAERVQNLRHARMTTQPRQIDGTAYLAAYDQLPPHDLSADIRGASFKSPERVSGDLTTIYAHHRESGTHWEFVDVINLRHNEIMARVAAQIATAT